MKKDSLCFIDLETQSAVGIRNVLEYVNHPSTRILCAVGRVNSGNVVWIPPDRAPQGYSYQTNADPNTTVCYSELPPFDPSLTWVAHNAYGFDSLLWNRLFPDYAPSRWLDTIPLCRTARLPAALEKVSQLLFGEGKKEFGKQVIEALSIAKYVNGKCRYNIGTPALWDKLIQYNIQDVLLLERVWDKVSAYFHEWELLEADREINTRGIAFDKDLLREILRAWNEIQGDAFDEVSELTDGQLSGTDLRSHQKVNKWLESRGIHLATLNKFHLEEELAEYPDIDPVVIEVLKARQTVTRGSKGKIERLLEIAAVTDNRLRNTLVFHGSHTGRWSGRGVQPQNLARPIDPDKLTQVIEYYESNHKLPDDVDGDRLTELTRPVFCAEPGKTLYIADYSAVEARTIAWLAGDENLLSAFRREDEGIGYGVYCEMASKLFGHEVTRKDKAKRQVGKVVVLGANYGMSGPKLEVYCKLAKPKVDLKALGLDPIETVKAYRKQIPGIVKFWYQLERDCIDVVKDRQFRQWRNLRFYMRDNYLAIQLPSGRELLYRNPTVEDIVPAFVQIYNLAPFKKPTILYDHPHGYRKSLYGALLAENVTQATDRDILAYHLRQCDRNYFPVVQHVHDSIVIEDYPGKLTQVTELLKVLPSWAAGLPYRVEVHESRRML